MSRSLSWLHLSDFHVGKDDYGQRQLFDQLLAHIEQRGQNQRPDFVIISGDLANKGREHEYFLLSENFFLPLVEILGSAPRYYTVPGNHDVDRSQCRILRFSGLLGDNPQLLDPTAEGARDRKTLMPRFSNFIKGDLFNMGVDHWLESDAGCFKDSFKHGSRSVGVVGINTAWLCHGEADRHQLSPGKAVVEEALKSCKGMDLKLVIGHHPVEWFTDDDVEPIGALLARGGTVYLHGHLHRTRSKVDNFGSGAFLSLQAGAAFQSRESEEWINRIMWCEVDFDAGDIRIEPLQWSRRHQEWALDAAALPNRLRRPGSDVWTLPLPEEHSIARSRSPRQLTSNAISSTESTSGWVQITSDFFKEIHSESIGNDRILAFFDGRSPSWLEALHPLVPRREIVDKLQLDILADAAQNCPSVNVLLGAGGEGKSTVIRQVAGYFGSGMGEWLVLWHNDPDTPLPLDYLQNLLRKVTTRILIISDEAELIAKSVFDAVKYLHERGRRNVNFLLSARDTDWLSVEADQLPWTMHVTFRPTRLRGLSIADARLIVAGWSQFGQPGLGRLAGLTQEAAASRLVEESLLEQSSEGAFLGAMLRARIGEELKGHVTSLLHRLRQRRCAAGTLADAFAYIAALHAENFLILNKDVLATALGYTSTTDLKRYVLAPLGEEAAVGSVGGGCILTRHRAIAETAVQLLGARMDFDEVFVDLVRSAVSTKMSGTLVPKLDRYERLSSHFFQNGNIERAVRIALALVTRYPHNKHYITKLSQLYREVGDMDSAARVFRRAPERCERDRAFYQDWASCELALSNFGTAAYLSWLCVSDQGGHEPVRNDRARSGLIGIALSLRKLTEQVTDPRVPAGADSAVNLCRRLNLDSHSKEQLSAAQTKMQVGDIAASSDTSTGLRMLSTAAFAAWEHKESPLPAWIPPPNHTSIRSLSDLLAGVAIARSSAGR